MLAVRKKGRTITPPATPNTPSARSALLALLALSALLTCLAPALSVRPAMAASYSLAEGFADVRWGARTVEVSGLTPAGEDLMRGERSYRRWGASQEYLGTVFDDVLWIFREGTFTAVSFRKDGAGRPGFDAMFEAISQRLGPPEVMGNLEHGWRTFEAPGTYLSLSNPRAGEAVYLTVLSSAVTSAPYRTGDVWAGPAPILEDPGGACGFRWGDSAARVLKRAKDLDLRVLQDESGGGPGWQQRHIDLGGVVDGNLALVLAELEGDSLRSLNLVFPRDLDGSAYAGYLNMFRASYGSAERTGRKGVLGWTAGRTAIELYVTGPDGSTAVLFRQAEGSTSPAAASLVSPPGVQSAPGTPQTPLSPARPRDDDWARRRDQLLGLN